jgi:acetyl-CoA acetyltransferase/uncharacterized OB-fold protein
VPVVTAARPLPQPTLASRAFWTEGGEGRLGIAHCEQCDGWLHPPLPMCPYCRSRDVAIRHPSGRAIVIGFTVNRQPWLADFPPPYVVAVVALEEDPRARLTTNIVNCDPDAVSVGMAVRVLFEAHDDVWIPLFEPDDRDTALPLPDPLPRLSPRPPASDQRFEHQVAITGVGQSAVGRRLMRDPVSLAVDACLEAVADAGLTLEDIDGLSTYPGAFPGGLSEGGVSAVEEALQVKPTWVNGGGDLPGQNGSVIAAMLAVAAGLCRHVLCFRTVWEASHAALVRAGELHVPPARATGSIFEWRAPYGAMSAANWIACHASNYQARFGSIKETLGHIAVVEREGARRNPEALHRDVLTMDDYLGARLISTPFGLYDCDVPCDGAVAVVISRRDAAEEGPRQPVFVEAVGTQVQERLSWDQGTMSHLPQSLGPSSHLWTRTSLKPSDVDVALLYDGFTFNALSWLEGLGFCELGGAREFIDGGKTIGLDGELPLNPHGGQLSAGRLHGYGLLREAIIQLRGEGGERQVRDARTAVVTAGGGVPSGVLLLRNDH